MNPNLSLRRRSKLALCSAGVLLACSLGACTSNEKYEAIKEDPTPNMLTLNERVEDADNAWTVSRNENWRMFWKDMGRVWMTDRPSRMAREVIPRP